MLAHRYACYYSPEEEVDTPKRFDNMEFVQNEELWLDEISQLMSCGNYGGDIAYDENGNAIIVQDIRFKWSAGRILDGVDYLDTDGSILISDRFTYDEKGIRTSKTVNGKTTYYTTVDGTITSQYELDEQGEVINEMVFLYDSSGNLIGFTYGGNTYFYIKNHMNDVMGIADAYGTVHWQYETNSEVQTDIELNELAELNPMLYRSYYCDRESGIYYLQSRYYLPDFGRFFNADLPEYAKLQKDDYAGTNLFAYCNNDPVNNSDPTGYYSASKAKAYAEKWWKGHNTKQYKTNGADCANFVSQCLYAGKISSMTNVWYHKRKNGRMQISKAWGRASNLYRWLCNNRYYSKLYTAKTAASIDKAGEFLYKYRNYHCCAAIFFDLKNDDGIMEHAALSGQIVRTKVKGKYHYDIYYYAHSVSRSGKKTLYVDYDLNTKKVIKYYASLKSALDGECRIYILILK